MSLVKPNGLDGLDTGNSLYSSILAAYEFGILDKELVGDTALTTTAVNVTDANIGKAKTFDATADAVAETTTVTTDCTILVVTRLNGTRNGGLDSEIHFVSYVGSGDQISLEYSGFTPFKFESFCRSNFVESPPLNVEGDGFVDDAAYGAGHAVAATFTSDPGTMKMCVNGTIQTDTQLGVAQAISGNQVLEMMPYLGVDGSANVGAIVIFDGVLSDANLQSITNDPWALFTATALAITTEPSTVTRGETGVVLESSAGGFEATQGTGTVTYGGESCTVTAWSDTSITVTIPSSIALQHDATGYTFLVTTDGAATAESGTIPFNEPAGYDYVDITFGSVVVNDDASVYSGDTASTLNGAQYVYENVTSEGIAVTNISVEGYVTLASLPTVTQTFDGYVIESDGTIRTTRTYTISVGQAPVCTLQPQDVTINENEETTFTTTWTNAVSYQWYRDNVIIAGETGVNLTVTGTLSNNGSIFYVRALSSDSLETQSDSALLTVLAAPTAPVTFGVNSLIN